MRFALTEKFQVTVPKHVREHLRNGHRDAVEYVVLADGRVEMRAVVAVNPLLTRDPKRVRTYFPGIEVLEP